LSCLCCQGHEDSPLWYIKLPDDATARRICERSILVKGMFELWGEGETFEQCRDAAVACPADKKAPYFKPEVSFKVRSWVRCTPFSAVPPGERGAARDVAGAGEVGRVWRSREEARHGRGVTEGWCVRGRGSAVGTLGCRHSQDLCEERVIEPVRGPVRTYL
jgi:hypothetical protein